MYLGLWLGLNVAHLRKSLLNCFHPLGSVCPIGALAESDKHFNCLAWMGG